MDSQSSSIDLYSSQFESDYQSDSQLDRYDLNDSFTDDSQCSFDVNSDNTYETEKQNPLKKYKKSNVNI